MPSAAVAPSPTTTPLSPQSKPFMLVLLLMYVLFIFLEFFIDSLLDIKHKRSILAHSFQQQFLTGRSREIQQRRMAALCMLGQAQA